MFVFAHFYLFIIICFVRSLKSIWEVNLAPKHEPTATISVNCVAVTPNSMHVYAGLSNGKMMVINPELGVMHVTGGGVMVAGGAAGGGGKGK